MKKPKQELQASANSKVPIISRINTSEILESLFTGMIIENLRKYNRIGIEDFYDIKH